MSDQLTRRIRNLCRRGYQLLDQGNSSVALRWFYRAWTLIPKPQTQYEEAGWVLHAIGDTYYQRREYRYAQEALSSALCCRSMADNPVIHLRLGQALEGMARKSEADQHLLKAYLLGGEQVYARENGLWLVRAQQLRQRHQQAAPEASPSA